MDRAAEKTRASEAPWVFPQAAVVRHVLVVMRKGPAAVHLASSLIQRNVFAHVADSPDRAVRMLAGTLQMSAVLLHRDVPGAPKLLSSMTRNGRLRDLPVVVLGDEPVIWNGNTVVTSSDDVDGLLDLLWRVC